MPFADESLTAAPIAYRPSWPGEFAAVAGTLRVALGPLALAVDHIGSTSVPGMPAKDCIDIQVRVALLDRQPIVRALSADGFRLREEPWNTSETSFGVTSPKLVFAPPPGARAVNVHVRVRGSANARFALLFRDYLRADAVACRAWAEFKIRLAASVPDLLAYGQIKQPATVVLMESARRWARQAGWEPA